MRYSIDRVECGVATLINERAQVQNVPLAALPADVREGDILEGDAGMYTLVDREETARKRQELQDRLHQLVQRHQ